jgi:hypothetical protein
VIGLIIVFVLLIGANVAAFQFIPAIANGPARMICTIAVIVADIVVLLVILRRLGVLDSVGGVGL